MVLWALEFYASINRVSEEYRTASQLACHRKRTFTNQLRATLARSNLLFSHEL